MFLWSFFLNQFCIFSLIFFITLLIFGKKHPKFKVISFNLFAIFAILGLFDVICTTFFAPPYANFRTNSTDHFKKKRHHKRLKRIIRLQN